MEQSDDMMPNGCAAIIKNLSGDQRQGDKRSNGQGMTSIISETAFETTYSLKNTCRKLVSYGHVQCYDVSWLDNVYYVMGRLSPNPLCIYWP
eukprot:5478859-Amphidinium_carterae.2